jgi:hypothetical protein
MKLLFLACNSFQDSAQGYLFGVPLISLVAPAVAALMSSTTSTTI